MTEDKTINKVKIPEVITVGDFAHRLSLPVAKVVAELMKNGVMATINELIDFETAAIIGEYLGYQVEKEEKKEGAKQPIAVPSGKLEVRPPIIAVLGHVDHGKTSLLDAIRETNVVARESGGITQHIGAYQIERKNRAITFLDTPGHAAFEKMREHGAQLTDIVILIIAADDGVRPQTIEAINHAKKANTPIVVVITKIDKPEADANRVLQQIAEIGLVPEEWGGKTPIAKVSAKTKEGVDDLLDLLLLVSDLDEFMADPKSAAVGVVIESNLDRGKGPVATILIKNGTLALGDYVSVGETYGKVRSMEDYTGKKIKEAEPSMPVQISGLKVVPQVADLLQGFSSEREAKAESQNSLRSKGIHKLANIKKLGLEELSVSMAKRGQKELSLVLKADVKGSLEAVKESLNNLGDQEVTANIISEGIGNITENDISMAKASGGLVIGFNVTMPNQVEQLSKREKVTVSIYKIIYELLDDIKAALSDMLEPEIHEIVVGQLEILKVFVKGKGKMVVGGKVKSGKIEKNLPIKVTRENKEITRGASVVKVKKEKDEVKEVVVGGECGIELDRELEITEGDVVEEYRVEKIKRTL